MANFLSIPDEIKLDIFSFLSYDEMTRIRLVCKDFNGTAMDCLNRGFLVVEKFHSAVYKEVRSKLPRRESERRDHKFSRHADILSAIETRLSLLQITYAKYIEAGYCCFIPGKVLDELYRVLRYIQSAKEPPRSHEVLLELRDISSMAMEHFEEKVLPPLKKILEDEGVTILPGGLTVGVEHSDIKSSRSRSSLKRTPSSSLWSGPLAKRRRFTPPDFEFTPATSIESHHSCNDGVVERVVECEKIILQQEAKIEEQSRMLSELNRKLMDCNHRFNDLADVLCNHYESSLLQDRISALIQPVRGLEGSQSKVTTTQKIDSWATSNSSSSFTSIIQKPASVDDKAESISNSLIHTPLTGKVSKRYGRCNTKSTEKRVQLLNDNMDALREEMKF